jgi:hypothetical protein
MLAYLDTVIGFAVVMLAASLIITILTQAISAAASFRGSSLRWGLRQLFKNIDPSKLPTIAANADKIAEQVLTHDLTSDSIFSSIQWIGKVVPDEWVNRYRLASAIRPEELVGILKQWATSTAPPFGIPASEINALLDAKSPMAERQIKMLTETSAALSALALDKAPALIEETVKTVRNSAGNLEAWFDTTMDRVSQQFGMYMRTWTVILSFALAGVAGLDALQLINTLYRNGDFRTAVVGTAPNLLARADQILPPGAQSNADAVDSAMTGLYADAIGGALKTANVSASAMPAGIKNRDQAQDWIRQNVTDPTQQKAALDAFPAAADQAFSGFMQKAAGNASAIRDLVSGAGIQIAAGWPQGFNWRQLLGVLITGALLSLGAPFWFNSLKALTNLRPAVAGKLKDEEKGS